MASLSTFLGGGGGLKLAPDIGFLSRGAITFDPSGGLTTALSLTGKWIVPFLWLDQMTAETHTVKLTVDGVVIWNETFSSQTYLPLLGYSGVTSVRDSSNDVPIICEQSLLLEVQSTTDTSQRCNYKARPIV